MEVNSMELYNFSVLMPVYHKEKVENLKMALESIWDTQTVKPNEIIIVKDGPLTEALDTIIDIFILKMPLRIIRLEKNVGQGIALARGIEACTNEIVARMDSDDVSHPARFEVQLEKIKEGYDVVSCWSSFFENTLENTIAIKRRPENHKDIVSLAKRRSPVLGAGVMYKKSAVLEAGNYQNIRQGEDYYLWICMIMKGAKFYNIQTPLYFIRTSKEQIERRGGIKYLKNEIKLCFSFYKMGFYSCFNLIENILIRSIVRIAPRSIRSLMMRKIWNS
jgi:glycosyltransferase involved in cell wall biosynthesis